MDGLKVWFTMSSYTLFVSASTFLLNIKDLNYNR